MFFPFITPSKKSRKLFRRKGGGGGRGGGGGGGGRGGSVPIGGGSTGGRGATSYGSGGAPRTVIPAGQPFAGRSAGGGTRNDVYGTQTYGSGYPGAATQRGVAGAGFPFFFWPVVWGGGIGAGGAYLYDREYGDANNASRPGGALLQAPFKSVAFNTTYHVLADNATVTALIDAITTNCASSLPPNANTTIAPLAFDPAQAGSPRPEQAVQYYRASSVALTLDGYNNTGALSDDPSAPNTALPTGIDTVLLDCLNQTIGAAVPLIDGAASWRHHSGQSVGFVGFAWLVFNVLSMVI